MVMSILQIVILVMVKCSLSLKVLHQLPQSEILDIVERSWIENDIPIENTGLDNTDENEQVVFILRPTSINVCSKDLLLDHLPKQSNKLYADDAADPNILIGPMQKVRLYQQLGAKKVKTVVDEDFIYLLDEDFAVGMRENNSLYNYERSTSPCILSAPKDKLNLLFRFANYVPRVNSAVTWPDSYNWHGYCHICDDILKSPTKLEKDGLIVIAGFIFQWTPMLYNWLSTLLNQEVKSKIFYIIYNNVTEHEEVIKEVTSSLEGLDGLVLGTSFFKDKELSDIRGHSAVMCSALECQYLFTVDSEVALLRNNIISHLVQFNKSVITAPVTFGRERSNFWGDITEGGWYRRSPDYFDIIDGAWGLFVVPYIKLMYLTRSDALPDYQGHEIYSDSDTDMAMCGNYRNKTTLMWLVTTLNCALYTDMTPPDSTLPLPNSDLYAAATNWHSWVEFTLNKPVAFNVLPVEEVVGGCSEDALVLPLFTEVYCKAFLRAFSSYTWANTSTSRVQTLLVMELRYQLIVEGVISKSVVPYIRMLFNIETTFDIPHENMVLFIQEPNDNTEFYLKRGQKKGLRAFHVIWFWTDSLNQGIHFMDKSCKTHLPSGTLLVIEDTGEKMLNLIATESRNVGIYVRVLSLN